MNKVKERKPDNLHLVRGFTLLELLLVIGIISILAGVFLQGLSGFRSQGRDSQRIADLRIVEEGLEQYYAKCGYYPGPVVGSQAILRCPITYDVLKTNPTGPAINWLQMADALTGSNLGISSVPNDPLYDPVNPASPNYEYKHDTTGLSSYLRYLVRTKFEDNNNHFYLEDVDNDGPGFTGSADFNNLDCGNPNDEPHLDPSGILINANPSGDLWYCIGL